MGRDRYCLWYSHWRITLKEKNGWSSAASRDQTHHHRPYTNEAHARASGAVLVPGSAAKPPRLASEAAWVRRSACSASPLRSRACTPHTTLPRLHPLAPASRDPAPPPGRCARPPPRAARAPPRGARARRELHSTHHTKWSRRLKLQSAKRRDPQTNALTRTTARPWFSEQSIRPRRPRQRVRELIPCTANTAWSYVSSFWFCE